MRVAQKPRPINRSGDYTNMLRWRDEEPLRTLAGGVKRPVDLVAFHEETMRRYPNVMRALHEAERAESETRDVARPWGSEPVASGGLPRERDEGCGGGSGGDTAA